MTVLGMDIAAARDLVRGMTNDADTITSISSQLTQQLESTTWYGNDANTFRSDWSGQYVPTLNRIIDALRENAQILARQADDQERASS